MESFSISGILVKFFNAAIPAQLLKDLRWLRKPISLDCKAYSAVWWKKCDPRRPTGINLIEQSEEQKRYTVKSIQHFSSLMLQFQLETKFLGKQ